MYISYRLISNHILLLLLFPAWRAPYLANAGM